MALSNELVSQFAKVVKSSDKSKTEKTLFGTIVEYNGRKYMRIDGSDLLTPISSTTNVEADERVTGVIKNHSLIVTGNLSSPSARTEEVEQVGTKISEFEIIVADKVSVGELNAERGRIDELVSDNVKIHGELEANTADIKELEADNVTIHGGLSAVNADITELRAENVEIDGKLEAADADIKSLQADNVVVKNQLIANEAAIGDLEAKNVEVNGQLTAHSADIETLKTDKLSAEDAKIKYANIDFSNIGKAAMEYFYAQSGLIRDVVVGDQTITGHLVGVTITGDLIEANTLKADKLVIKGSDGLYYKLNTDGISTSTEQTDYNSLNGSIIRAKSITATQISVKDLVAFDATIGGFNITDDSLYSGVKSSVDNTTRGIYMDNDGQMAIGDADNYLKYFKDVDGRYKLAVSASVITFGGSSTLEDAVTKQVQDSIKDSALLGQNLILDTSDEWCYKHIDIGTVFHIPTIELANEYGLKDGDQLIFSAYLKSTGAKRLASGWLLTDGSYDLVDFNKSLVIEAGTEGRAVCNDIIFDTSYTYLALAILNPDYEVQSSKLFIANVAEAKDDATEAYRCIKLEKGIEVTDWSLAPKDWENRIISNTATANNAQISANNAQSSANSAQSSADNAQISANNAQSKANSALLEVDAINAMLRTLVTGKNGETMMVQTDRGWTFNISSIQDTLGGLSSNISDLNAASGDAKNKINILEQNVSDLGVYTEYIKFGVDNGKPCIILGEEDSNFKVVITNTDIRFMEGSVVPASISNQALNIEKAVITDELTHGNFTWTARSNGHYSLVWKG